MQLFSSGHGRRKRSGRCCLPRILPTLITCVLRRSSGVCSLLESVVVVWQTEPIGFGNPFAFGTCFTRCFLVLPATIDIGFVEHLKLPHYVDFQAELDLVRRLRAEWEARQVKDAAE